MKQTVTLFRGGPRQQFRTPTGHHYLTGADAAAHRVHLHTFVAPVIEPKAAVFAGHPHVRITDGPLEFVTRDAALVAALREAVSSGWTMDIRYCRDGGRLVIVDGNVR